MTLTLNIPEGLMTAIEAEAAREDILPTDYATLLLYVAAALHQQGKDNTLFQDAVRQFLLSRTVDAKQVSHVLDELIEFCIKAPIGDGKTGAAIAAAKEDVLLALPTQTLPRWNEPVVHEAIDVSADKIFSPQAPVNTLLQRAGRTNRDKLYTSEWPSEFFDKTFGSLADDPVERLPQGDYEDRESLT